MKYSSRFFLIFLFFQSSFFASEQLPSLSYEDTSELKRLFCYFFRDQELGYVLFGDKPMSFCFFPTATVGISTKENIFKIYKRGHIPLLRGLEVWNKIQNDLSTDFVFIITEKNNLPEWFFLINRKMFFAVFNENIDVFKEWYGSDITAESFLNELITNKTKIQELLKHHLPLGILLGFGRKNAELFQRRESLSQGIPFFNSTESVRSKLVYLDQSLTSTSIYHPLLFLVCPVNFAADLRLKESKQLQIRYTLAHRKLTKLFSEDDWFLEVFAILQGVCDSAG